MRDSTTGLTLRVGTASPNPTRPSEVVRRRTIEIPAQVAPPAFAGSPRVNMSMSVIFRVHHLAGSFTDRLYFNPAFFRRALTVSLSCSVRGVWGFLTSPTGKPATFIDSFSPAGK